MDEARGDALFRFSMGYLTTPPGILGIFEIIGGIIVLACNWSGRTVANGAGFITFVGIMSVILTGALLFSCISGLRDGPLGSLPWDFIQLVASSVWCFFYFVCGCIAAHGASTTNYGSAYGACTFFAWVVAIVYGVDTYRSYTGWKESRFTGMEPEFPHTAGTTAPQTPI